MVSSRGATLDNLKVTFHTNDDDKEGDTKVMVSIKGPPIWSQPKGRLHMRTDIAPARAQWSQTRDQHYGGQSTHTFDLSPSSLGVDILATDRFIVCIEPNRHDTWKFSVTLHGSVSDGTAYSFEKTALRLTQDVRCIQWNLSTGLLPFDVADGPKDANGFPFNASWGAQVPDINHLPNPLVDCRGLGTDEMSACSRNFSGNNTPSFFSEVVHFFDSNACAVGGPNGFNGHANFVVATYDGKLTFIDHKDWTDLGDNDYTFYLEPKAPNERGGLTTANAKLGDFGEGMEVEFNASDTIDHFHSAWWQDFHQLVDDDQLHASRLLPDRSYAIITGLLDLDCGERCKSELHPIYAMAVRVKEFQVGNALDEVWAIFVRNFGTEGGCGGHDKPINLPGYIFTLPWRTGATDVTVGELTSFEPSGEQPEYSKAQGESVQIALHFTPGRGRRFVDGALHLLWTGPVQPLSAPPVMWSKPKPEARLRAKAASPPAWVQLPEDKKRELKSRLQALRPVTAASKMAGFKLVARAPAPQEVTGAPKHAVAVPFRPRIVPGSAPDPERLQRAQVIRTALCEAYGNKVPGANARMCSKAAATCLPSQPLCDCARPASCMAPAACRKLCGLRVP